MLSYACLVDTEEVPGREQVWNVFPSIRGCMLSFSFLWVMAMGPNLTKVNMCIKILYIIKIAAYSFSFSTMISQLCLRFCV